MDAGLEGKVALVTGASRGIGAATVLALAREGAAVALVSRKLEGLEQVAAAVVEAVPQARLLAVAAHVSDEEAASAAVAAASQELGPIDVLVNNAGTNPYFGPMLGLDRARADKTVEINQWAPVLWTQLVARAGMAERGGAVVNVASVGGLLTEPGIGWYNGTKAALIHLTRQLAAELAPSTRVNAIAPGIVRTQLARAMWESYEPQLAASLPLARIGEPNDIADVITFLAGAGSRWMTGQTLVVDGGAAVRISVG